MINRERCKRRARLELFNDTCIHDLSIKRSSLWEIHSPCGSSPLSDLLQAYALLTLAFTAFSRSSDSPMFVS